MVDIKAMEERAAIMADSAYVRTCRDFPNRTAEQKSHIFMLKMGRLLEFVSIEQEKHPDHRITFFAN